jgi:hypothetical protein
MLSSRSIMVDTGPEMGGGGHGHLGTGFLGELHSSSPLA